VLLLLLLPLLLCGAVAVTAGDAAARAGGGGRSGLSREKQKARMRALVLVKRGVVKLREGDYVAALELFTDAFRIFPSPKIQFNVGQTYKELGRYLDAIGAYERFLRDAPPDTSEALRKLARDNVRELFRKIVLLRVEVSVPGARVSIDGQPRGVSPLPAPLRLMPGAHSMVVKKDGYVTVALDLRLGAGGRVLRKVTLHKPRSKVVQVIWKTVRKPKKGLPVLWTGVALAGAAGLAAAITGALALVEQQRFDDPKLTLAERRAAGERGRRYRDATDGLLVAAGVAAVATLVWYLARVRPSGGSERVRVLPGKGLAVTPYLAPGGAGLTLRF
jgi:hypothetical protein